MSGRPPSQEPQDRSLRHSSASQSTARDQQDERLSHGQPSGRLSNPNVFSDDFSLEPLDRPGSDHTWRNPSISSIDSSVTLRSSNASQNPPKAFVDGSEPLSNPFDDNARSSLDETTYRSSLPQKGSVLNRNSSITTASSSTSQSVAQRSMSTSSHFSIPRALSPYTGATGPSHPYGMYPQVGVGRSPSVTTASTVRQVDRPLVGPSAPQHPYAMYPQNIVLEEGFDSQSIPVGFPGHGQAYHRAPGQADDDVGDIIGPDGHLEQLPPYSRYPDGIPPKTGLGPASIASANRDRDFQAGDGESPPSGTSSRTLVGGGLSANAPALQPAAAETAAAVDNNFNEKVGEKRKHRMCCGVPIWMLVLIGVVLLIGAGIGGAIGGVLGTKSGEKSGAESASSSLDRRPSVVTVTATSRMDATPLSILPTGLLPVPTGLYQIPAIITNQSKFCVPQSSFTASWSCMSQGGLDINVTGTPTEQTIEFYSAPINGTFTYGAQAPILPTPMQSLRVMLDKDDTSLGPALFFYTLFDKLVIVQEDVFPTTLPSKRSVSEADLLARQWSRKQVAAQPGDKPWFCWWNNTIMEFFLYINETTHDDFDDSDGISLGPTLTITGAAASSSTSGPHATSTLGGDDDDNPTTRKSKRDDLQNYPRRIKIEEKRGDPSAQRPYCQQMQVMDDLRVQGPISPIQIGIDEIVPAATTTSSVAKRDAVATKTLAARGSYESTCYCVWLTD
ncbi:hypothetical protein VTN02DRAFT_5005 [Thermoascus thermophilus]